MLIVPGAIVDRFVVERLLSESGLSRIYRVKDRARGSAHGLRVLRLAGAREKQAFLEEGQVQARIRHPNLVPLTDVVEIDGEIGLVTDFVDGPSLADVIAADGPFAVDELPAIFDQLCRGVSAAHAAGVLHGDLKAENVLLEVTDLGITVRIADLGIARVVAGFREGSPAGGAAGPALGTLGYAAPEALGVGQSVDHRADVFSLGCIGYEMLAGRPPFLRRDEAESIRATQAGDHAPLSDVAFGLPAALVAALERAIHPDAARRFDSVELLRRAVAGTAEEPAAPAPAEPSPAPAPPGEAPVATEAPPAQVAVSPDMAGTGRTIAVAWVAALAFVFAIPALGLLWIGHEHTAKMEAADARVATLATNLDRAWLGAPAPMAAALHRAGGTLADPVLKFRTAATARARVTEARALVRAVRSELARQAQRSPTPEAVLAMSELESIDTGVHEAEQALAEAEALRTEWPAAVAGAVGWVDPVVPAASNPLPPAHELPIFIAGPGF